MSEEKPLYEISADTGVNDNGEAYVLLFGDSGVPDVIFCDGETYRPERTCYDDGNIDAFRCDKCGAFAVRSLVTDCTKSIPIRYCPNCGAKVIQDV